MVTRDGVRRSVDASDIVPGDLVFLEAGDRVPSDARLLSASNLTVMEAALTGGVDLPGPQWDPCCAPDRSLLSLLLLLLLLLLLDLKSTSMGHCRGWQALSIMRLGPDTVGSSLTIPSPAPSHPQYLHDPLPTESLPCNKEADVVLAADASLGDRHNMVHAGSMVATGQCTAVVTATGDHNELGRINRMMQVAWPRVGCGVYVWVWVGVMTFVCF